MNKQLKIGEFSKLCRVTVKTLRYYEDKCILVPARIDENSGYRFYSLSQTLILSRIQHLKRLGLTIDEIVNLFANGEDKPDIDTIRLKIDECKAELKRLELQRRELESLESESIPKNKMEKIKIKSIPSRIVASHRQVINSYNDLGPLCYNVIGPEMMRIGCTCPEPQYCYSVEHDSEHKEENIDIEYCEAVGEIHEDTAILKFYKSEPIERALCCLHYGAYEDLSQSMAEFLEYIENNGFEILGQPRFCYIDGAWNKDNVSEWLTEVQIPIK